MAPKILLLTLTLLSLASLLAAPSSATATFAAEAISEEVASTLLTATRPTTVSVTSAISTEIATATHPPVVPLGSGSTPLADRKLCSGSGLKAAKGWKVAGPNVFYLLGTLLGLTDLLQSSPRTKGLLFATSLASWVVDFTLTLVDWACAAQPETQVGQWTVALGPVFKASVVVVAGLKWWAECAKRWRALMAAEE